MKVGSKVVCIKTVPIYNGGMPAKGSDPVEGDILTVRDLSPALDNGEMIIRFEEIINRKSPTGKEYGYAPFYFRELLPNEDLSETTYEDIMQEIEQTELTPQTA